MAALFGALLPPVRSSAPAGVTREGWQVRASGGAREGQTGEAERDGGK